MTSLDVLLLEDHDIARLGMVLTVGAAADVVSVFEAASVTEARQVLAAQAGIQLALVDLHLDDSHGADTVRALRDVAPDVPLLAMSADDGVGVALQCLRAGAMGFVPKWALGASLLEAIRTVLSGHYYLPAKLFVQLPGFLDADAAKLCLWPWPIEWASAAGCVTNEAIAAEHGISDVALSLGIDRAVRRLCRQEGWIDNVPQDRPQALGAAS